jgi:hypothetical protein
MTYTCSIKEKTHKIKKPNHSNDRSIEIAVVSHQATTDIIHINPKERFTDEN